MKLRQIFTMAAVAFGLMSNSAMAQQQTIVVTPLNEQGWSRASTTADGDVNFIVDMTAPSGVGALQLTTAATTTSRAQYMHAAATPLADVTELSYYTKQNVGSPPIAAPAYQLVTCLNGVVAGNCVGFTTLVFEPYQNGVVIPDEWQLWDVDEGLFWSTRTFTCSNGTIVGTPGGPATYTLEAIKTACPSAVVIGFGVNIGTNNPMYDVETDLFNFNGTTYDFEPFSTPRSKDDCKNGGWRTTFREDGTSFRNQGECVSYVNHNP